jgi:hypothetical protein
MSFDIYPNLSLCSALVSDEEREGERETDTDSLSHFHTFILSSLPTFVYKRKCIRAHMQLCVSMYEY